MSLTRSTLFSGVIAVAACIGCEADRNERNRPIQNMDDVETTGTGTAAPSGRGAIGGAVIEHRVEGEVPGTTMTDDAGHTLHDTGADDSEQANTKRDTVPRQTRRNVRNRRTTAPPLDSTINQNPAKAQDLDVEREREVEGFEVESDRDVDKRPGY